MFIPPTGTNTFGLVLGSVEYGYYNGSLVLVMNGQGLESVTHSAMPTYINPEDGMDSRQSAAFRARTGRQNPHESDPHTDIARAVERATGTDPVKGEDLLPPELQEQYLAAKHTLAEPRAARKSKI